MSLKNLLPSSIRDRLRPAYQGLQNRAHRFKQSMVQSALWPKPADWHRSKSELANITDSTELYEYSVKEFGVLQVQNEIVPFLDYISNHDPAVIGEIGLKHGGNSFLFLRKFSRVELYLGMDLVLENIDKLKFMRRDGQRIRILEGNSQLPAIVEKAKGYLADRQFDFLFIDGDHEYDGVLEDLVQWYPLVRHGGLIAFHDIVPDEETRTGKKPAGTQLWGGGVHKLWANIKPHFEHKEFVDNWEQGGFGIGVITKPDDQPLGAEMIAELRKGG